MKAFFLFSILTISSIVASADRVRTVHAGDMTCSDLRSLLASEGALNILSGNRGWGDMHYASRSYCDVFTVATPTAVQAANGRCYAGFVCQEKNQGAR